MKVNIPKIVLLNYEIARRQSMRSSTCKWIGIILLIISICSGIFMFMANLDYYGTGTRGWWGGVVAFSVCALPFLILGIILIAYAMKYSKQEGELIDLSNFLKSYRRIPISKVSKEFGKTPSEIEIMIGKCIEIGFIDGYIDFRTKEFFVKGYVSNEISVQNCPNCSRTISKVFQIGSSAICDYCGATIYSQTRFEVMPERKCEICGENLKWKPHYQKWYCDRCQRYF